MADRSKTVETCQIQTHAPPQTAWSFDHLVGAGEQRRWHREAKRFGSFQIDDEFELGRLLDRISTPDVPSTKVEWSAIGGTRLCTGKGAVTGGRAG
jgi:hypothetical protein